MKLVQLFTVTIKVVEDLRLTSKDEFENGPVLTFGSDLGLKH